MTCLNFDSYIPEVLRIFKGIIGYEEICFPDWFPQVIEWSKQNLISFDELVTTFNYLIHKGLIYIQ